MAPLVEGLEELEAAVRGFAPEAVADSVGIPATEIRRLALEMTAADCAVCYSRMGASTQSFGGLCQWLTNVLNIVTSRGWGDVPGAGVRPPEEQAAGQTKFIVSLNDVTDPLRVDPLSGNAAFNGTPVAVNR